MSFKDKHLPQRVEPNADVALERAFALAERAPSTGETVLRNAVWAFVDEAKARNDPPEQVIVGLKKIARRVGFSGSPTRDRADKLMADREDVLARAVTWCIERYFAGDKRPPI